MTASIPVRDQKAFVYGGLAVGLLNVHYEAFGKLSNNLLLHIGGSRQLASDAGSSSLTTCHSSI
ncbi:MAG: hypothetical protein ACXACD_20090, partial [Candidatus Thorarchaeota archaeon]